MRTLLAGCLLAFLVPAQERVVCTGALPRGGPAPLLLLERGRVETLVPGAAATLPAIARDGSVVAFLDHAHMGTRGPALTLIDLATRTRRTLVDSMPPQAVRFSPDGRALVFAGWNADHVAEIFRLEIASGKSGQLTRTTGRSPVWSPDGTKIAFMGFGPDDHDGLMLMQADGSGLCKLAPSRARDSRPDFSRDGRWLVYQDFVELDEHRIRGVVHLIGVDGNGGRVLSPPEVSAFGARFTPTGEVLYLRGRLENCTLVCCDPATGTQRDVLPLPHADDDDFTVLDDGSVVVTVVEAEQPRVVLVRGGVLATLHVGGAVAAAIPPRSPRARDIGVPFTGTPGPDNAITDVPGVLVGMTTLIHGDAAAPEARCARTGVTAILPRGQGTLLDPVMAGTAVLNGNGEMTGTAWISESGFLEGPVFITNTESVGTVRDAAIQWRRRHGAPDESGSFWSLPLVAETWDGRLNDLGAAHVRPEHVDAALDGARSGPVAEGNAGGGTGMHTHGWKGGTGTASRRVGTHTLGVLVQSNYGRAPQLTIAGVPVGAELTPPADPPKENGSIIVVIATDAPLLPHQLQRLARRAPLALGRMGSYAGNSSGDFMLAFSTANPGTAFGTEEHAARFLGNDALDPLFIAVVEATEEAIVNALIAARTLEGQGGAKLHALPHDKLREILGKYGRLTGPK